ncbi:hypothetical protein [Lentilactobacillus rapi]|nr:hypothetical protein [Lentilactobacillus rapi]
MKLRILVRFILQTTIILVLGYFFNLDKNAHFVFEWNGFNIWLIISWLCQLPLCIRKQLYPGYRSIATQGMKRYKQDLENRNRKHIGKKGWDVTNPGAIEGDRVVFYSKMHDDQFATVAQIALAIIYGLLGPVVLVGELLFDWFWSTLKSN